MWGNDPRDMCILGFRAARPEVTGCKALALVGALRMVVHEVCKIYDCVVSSATPMLQMQSSSLGLQSVQDPFSKAKQLWSP